MIPLTRETCNKVYGQLGIDVLNVDTPKLINSIKAEEINKGLLRGYTESIRLKENHYPNYVQPKNTNSYLSYGSKQILQIDSMRNTRKSSTRWEQLEFTDCSHKKVWWGFQDM